MWDSVSDADLPYISVQLSLGPSGSVNRPSEPAMPSPDSALAQPGTQAGDGQTVGHKNTIKLESFQAARYSEDSDDLY